MKARLHLRAQMQKTEDRQRLYRTPKPAHYGAIATLTHSGTAPSTGETVTTFTKLD
jgi:hypothetical protein